MATRRSILAAGALGAWGCATRGQAPGFVTARDGALWVEGAPYRFVGANLWYGAYLGASAQYGDQERLRRELDRLAELGVTNLRVLGSSEVSPLRNSLAIGFRDRTPPYNETLLRGLDTLLAEMGARGLRAVIYLANFWEWSGGFVTYLYWTNGGRYINAGDPAHPWPAFADFSSQFYASGEAVALYHDYVRAVISRVNSVTGVAYRDDPTIMTWQLANEPRPGGSEPSIAANMSAYQTWIADTARLVRSIDGRHLVSTGSEGRAGCGELMSCVRDAHAHVDYLTAHIWPQNWSWADPNDLAGTFETVEANTHSLRRGARGAGARHRQAAGDRGVWLSRVMAWRMRRAGRRRSAIGFTRSFNSMWSRAHAPAGLWLARISGLGGAKGVRGTRIFGCSRRTRIL